MADIDAQAVQDPEETAAPTTQDVPQSGSSDATLLLRIEEMIKTHLSQIDTLDEDIQKHKEMMDDIFLNNPTYQEHDKVAKEAIRIKSNTKKEMMKQPQVADLANKMKSLKSEKTELEEGMTDYLNEYQRLSGSNQIEDNDGQIREIILVPKLVKKGAYRP